MPRARLIKPTFFTNENLAELPPHGRLLFIGLWTIADREGRLEDRPKRIKAELFPYESVSVEPLLKKLEAGGFIVRYELNGKLYIAIPAFGRHQNPHHREPQSLIPAPGEPRAGLGLDPNPALEEPCPSPVLALRLPVTGNQLPVTGDPVAVTSEPEATPSELDAPPAERDLAETVISKLPTTFRHDELAREECYQFARDFPGMFAETAMAIEAVRRESKAPFPSNLRKHMPGWKEPASRSNGNGNRHSNRPEPTPEDDELMAHLVARTERRLGLVPLPDVRDGGDAADHRQGALS